MGMRELRSCGGVPTIHSGFFVIRDCAQLSRGHYLGENAFDRRCHPVHLRSYTMSRQPRFVRNGGGRRMAIAGSLAGWEPNPSNRRQVSVHIWTADALLNQNREDGFYDSCELIRECTN